MRFYCTSTGPIGGLNCEVLLSTLTGPIGGVNLWGSTVLQLVLQVVSL